MRAITSPSCGHPCGRSRASCAAKAGIQVLKQFSKTVFPLARNDGGSFAGITALFYLCLPAVVLLAAVTWKLAVALARTVGLLFFVFKVSVVIRRYFPGGAFFGT